MGSPVRRIVRLTIYFGWTVSLMPVQIVGLMLGCRWVATLPRFYHGWCCRILGLQVRAVGTPVEARPVLFVANHVSYLDITVLSALLPCSFVAKSEVAHWPFFGWLAKLQRSVFIDRRQSSTAYQRGAIEARLAAGDALVLFPEGTSGDGNRTLPFKSALFSVTQSIGDTPVLVQPVSIAYTRLDGMPIGRYLRPLFAWYGDMAMARHLWTVIGLGTVEIVVEFHPPTSLAECGSRKVLCRYCEGRVAGGLAAALAGRPQPVPEPPRPPEFPAVVAGQPEAALT